LKNLQSTNLGFNITSKFFTKKTRILRQPPHQ